MFFYFQTVWFLGEVTVEKLLSGNEQQVIIKRKKINSEIEQTTTLLENLQDLLVDGKIDSTAYSAAYSRYKSKREKLKDELAILNMGNNQYRLWLKKCISILQNLSGNYAQSTVKEKQKILSSIFPEKIFFENKNCRTTRINDVIRFILQLDKELKGKKRGQFSSKLKLSSRVESEGTLL